MEEALSLDAQTMLSGLLVGERRTGQEEKGHEKQQEDGQRRHGGDDGQKGGTLPYFILRGSGTAIPTPHNRAQTFNASEKQFLGRIALRSVDKPDGDLRAPASRNKILPLLRHHATAVTTAAAAASQERVGFCVPPHVALHGVSR